MDRVYGIFDRVSGLVLGPLFRERVDAAAIRTFVTVVKDPNTQIGQHPADFELLCFGQLTGRSFDALLTAEVVATGASFIADGPKAVEVA